MKVLNPTLHAAIVSVLNQEASVVRQFTGNERGLRLEPYDPNALLLRRNYANNTHDYANGSWTRSGLNSVTTSNEESLLVEDTGNTAHSLSGSSSLTLAVGDVATMSAIVRRSAGTRNFRLQFNNGAMWGGVNPNMTFDLTTGSVISATGVVGSATSLGNGDWYVVATSPAATASGSTGPALVLINNTVATYIGDGVSGIYVRAVQLERSATPSAYQKVTDWTTEYLAAGGPNIAMFQDTSGTTPVTAIEQPIGLILDKRFGLMRGPEMATNGSFDTATTGWTAVNATLSSVAGKLRIVATGGIQARAQQTLTTVIGRSYEVSYLVRSVSGNGTAGSYAANAAALYTTSTAEVSRSYIFTAVGTTTVITLEISGTPAAGVTSEFDNCSVRELPGNHASQATAAARPTLSARVNMLTKTENFADAVWSKTDTTVTATNGLAPDGSSTATLLTEGSAGTSQFLQINSAAPATTITLRRYVARGNHDWVRITLRDQLAANGGQAYVNLATGTLGQVSNSGTGTSTTCSVTAAGNGFWAITLTTTLPAGSTGISTTSLSALADGNTTRVSGGTRYEWHPQVEHGAEATRYQRVNTATDYDTVSFPHYLKFDGVDDALNVPGLDTGIDELEHWYLVAALQRLTVTAAVWPRVLHRNIANTPRADSSFILNPSESCGIDRWFNGVSVGSGTVTLTTGQLSVISGGYNGACRLRNPTRNLSGVSGADVTNLGAGVFVATKIGGNGFDVRLFALTVIADKYPTANEITSLERALANKFGITVL